jgi:hypothetical protein
MIIPTAGPRVEAMWAGSNPAGTTAGLDDTGIEVRLEGAVVGDAVPTGGVHAAIKRATAGANASRATAVIAANLEACA